MTYIVDANVFIQAKNLHYGLDFCPAFWDWLLDANRRGVLFSVDPVKRELVDAEDDLSVWVRAHNEIFKAVDSQTLPSLASVSQWVSRQAYEPSAVSTFLRVADYQLVAYAHAHGHVVVTHEKYAASAKKVKIPNVCIGLGVRCITPFEMLRTEGAKFILGS